MLLTVWLPAAILEEIILQRFYIRQHLEPDSINPSSTLALNSIELCLVAKEHRERSKSLKLLMFQWKCHDYTIERKHLSASTSQL